MGMTHAWRDEGCGCRILLVGPGYIYGWTDGMNGIEIYLGLFGGRAKGRCDTIGSLSLGFGDGGNI